MPRQAETDSAAYLALVQAQAAIRARAVAQATTFAATSAQQFTAWYDTAAITAWSAELAAQIQGILTGTARTTDAYMARALSMLAGKTIRPVGAVDVTGLRAGVTAAGAYARAADSYRWQQAQFDAIAKSLLTDTPADTPDIAGPLEAAIQRAVSVATMDVQLTDRAQAQANLADGAARGVVTGYRRVIHPELSKGGTCGMCVAASDRLYGVHEPRAVHDRCECTTLPVLEGNDPGSALNAGDLGRLYGDAGDTSRENLKKTRYQVDEHGELGLVLNPAGAKQRTAAAARRDKNKRPRRAKTPEQRAADLDRVRRQLADALPKVTELAQSDPAKWGAYLEKYRARLEQLGEAA